MERSSDEQEQARAEVISDAVKLALDMSRDGSGSLSAFLGDVQEEVASAAEQHLRNLPSKEVSRQGGHLASEAVAVALDVADSVKEGFTKDEQTRVRTVDTMAELVSFFGSMFIDTANKAVGSSAGQPATNRARLVTVRVGMGGSASASVWVVNRGPLKVEDAPVIVVRTDGQPEVEVHPKQLTIQSRGRARVDLRITDTGNEEGSFTDVLLLVPNVGSIVVRTIVGPANNSPSPSA